MVELRLLKFLLLSGVGGLFHSGLVNLPQRVKRLVLSVLDVMRLALLLRWVLSVFKSLNKLCRVLGFHRFLV